jgi:hypothetical protein
MTERVLAVYRNRNLLEMCYLGTVKYSFVLRSNLGMHMLKLDRCYFLETFKIYLLVQ